MRIVYNKLVRDRIPEIIQAAGHQPTTRVLDDSSYQSALLAKLLEEAQEARVATAEDLRYELADVLEVLRALAKTQNMTWEALWSAADRKRNERGGFDGRVFLEHVEQVDGRSDDC